MKIYQIVEGPIPAREAEGYTDDAKGFVVFALLGLEDGSLIEEDIHFPTWGLAMSLVDHFKDQIIPYYIDAGSIYD